jgi:ABC-type nitrate/sulfonate/bicarbonate transport system ATPase subunit
MKTLLPTDTRQRLSHSAATLRTMRQPAVVIVHHDAAELARLRAENARLTSERDAAQNAAAARAQREERVKAITLRVVDGRATWAAKIGLKRPPLVALTTRRVITADVWELPQADD